MYSNIASIGRASALAVLAFVNVGAFGADYYAAPKGSSSGNGSMSSPWDLASALSGSKAIKAGDTLWLRGGTYHGTFTSNLQGTSSSPIIVRQTRGEHATIDGGNSGGGGIFSVKGAYVWFWGFEVMSSDSNRISSQSTSWPTDIPRGEGVVIDQSTPHPGLKFINMLIHDTRQGVSFWKEAQNGELYGNIIYNNGWDGPDRGHGHGIYSQNQTGTMHLRDNIVFRNFDHGMQIYGSSAAYLNNYDVDANGWFNNGEPSRYGFSRNVLLGGDSVANNIAFTNNNFYTCKLKVGYSAPANNVKITGNYFPVSVELKATNVTITGNTFSFLSTNGISFSQSSYPNNTYLNGSPSGSRIVVRPNTYEQGRANIIVYNWGKAASASVDVSSVLTTGQSYEVLDVQNLNGVPVAEGTYNGSKITIPMTATTVSPVIGNASVQPQHTSSQFNIFVLVPTS
jgi:parallel beta helix pectate lyase-like protein